MFLNTQISIKYKNKLRKMWNSIEFLDIFAKDYTAFQVFKRNKYVKHTPINTQCFKYIILKL